jgi:hypothetical protein
MEKNPSVSFDEAKSLLLKFGSVKLVLEQIK